MPLAVQNYKITKLELTGLVWNIPDFSQLPKLRYFEVLLDHMAIDNLWNGKEKPMTNRLTVLLLNLWDYIFDLKYQQGKKKFLGCVQPTLQIEVEDDLHEVIPLNIFNISTQYTLTAIMNIWYTTNTSTKAKQQEQMVTKPKRSGIPPKSSTSNHKWPQLQKKKNLLITNTKTQKKFYPSHW